MNNQRSDSDSLRADIARLAYERFLERGEEHGSDVEDWLAAEQQVLLREASITAAPRQEANADATTATPRRRGKAFITVPPAEVTPPARVAR